MIPILDNGHGSVINGYHINTGNKYKFGMVTINEGQYCRDLVARIKFKLSMLEKPYIILTPEERDISLNTRVKRINENSAKWYNYDINNVYLISLHANLAGGTGFEVFTYYGKSFSDTLASYLGKCFVEKFPFIKLRTDLTDGDIDKEAGFYLLRKTKCPAILTENLFMDNIKDFTLMRDNNFREKLADVYVQMILNFY